MACSFQDSYFSLLPNEILLKILNKIDTFTLMCFCEIYECDYFLQERNVIKTIDLCKNYLLEDLNVLSKKVIYEYIITLNINCIYWVTGTNLRKFITKLINMENLYAIKTNLSLTSSDTAVYNKTKIKKLAVTLKEKDEIGFNKISTLESLYIDCAKPSPLSPLKLDILFPKLTKLWIDLEEPNSGHLIYTSISAGVKEKIFCKINAPIPSINFDYCGLKRYYNNRRSGQLYVMCCEKFSSEELISHVNNDDSFEINGNIARAWKTLEELHCSIPYGPKDARRLYLNEANLENIQFEELNFHHNGPICNVRCREAYKQILESSSVKSIKKICIMMCLFVEENKESVSIQETNGFKRKRVGVENTTNHSAEKIFKNFPLLEQLEIFVCPQTYHHSAIQAYPLIALFKNLTTLTLEIPIIVDGSFLIDVLKICRLLEKLKITSSSQHEKLNFNVCKALPHGISLKDFRYENHRIQMDRLIEQLCLIKSKKLQRLVLICEETDIFNSGPLKKFLEENSQLVFLYFLIRQGTVNSTRTVQTMLNFYMKKHPSKIFVMKRGSFIGRGYPVPDVHFYEMLKFDSNVATLHAVNDFIYF